MADNPLQDDATIEETRSEAVAETSPESLGEPQPKKRHHFLRTTIIIVAAVVVLAIVALLIVIFRGDIAPGDAAAKYDVLSYIQEDEVTDYIDTYRGQMGYADSDEGWAEFLSENDLTPASLRETTIRQLIIDDEVERKAAHLGLSVDESEVDSYIQTMKENYAFGSDSIWADTLAMYGRTEEEVRETYAHSLLEDLVCEAEVPVPSVDDAEIFSYLTSFYSDGLKTKHVYYLTVPVEDDESALDTLDYVQMIREGLATTDDLTPEIFGSAVQVYCTDEDLVARKGANGWSIDMSDYSESYQTAVENTKKNQVSDVFREEDGDQVSFSFIWIDDVVKLPDVSDEDIDSIDQEEYLSVLPDTLKSYFSDCTAQLKWEVNSQDYLADLYDQSNPVIYPIAYPLPSYYVEMPEEETDAADEATEGSEESAESESDASAEDGSSEVGSEEETPAEEDKAAE